MRRSIPRSAAPGCAALLASLLGGAALLAEGDAPAASKTEHDALRVAAEVDAAIERELEARGLTAVDIASDVEFLRRAYVDLGGCVPSAAEAAAFLSDERPEKRARLINDVLASERFGVQLGRVWRDWIAPAELPSEGNGGDQPIEATRKLGDWFAEQFSRGRPWDEIVAAIVGVDGELEKLPQALFYSLTGTDTGIPEPAGATRAISSLFLGLDLECAQCHDDPYREWKQTDFWSTAAFFRNMEAKFDGRYFASITESFGKASKGAQKTTSGDGSPNGSIAIPQGSFQNAGQVVAARYLLGDAIEAGDEQPLRPLFSEWIVSEDNPYFARAFVNRTWSYLFARGLVEPIDDMRHENVPSHPEVLDLLTAELIASGFDVRHLVRTIANTRAWQRSTRAPGDDEGELLAAYGRRAVKLMAADQLYDSLALALGEAKLDLRTYDAKEASRFGESSPVGDEIMEFQRLFETDENDATAFTHGIPQFLALLNHPRVSDGGRSVAQLAKDGVEPDAAVERLYLSTLSRPPSDDERREALEYIDASESRESAYAGVLWMLLNRSEFILSW